MPSKKTPSFTKALPYILVGAGIIGIICSLFLTYDQIKVWQNPSYQPACSLNPVVSCGSVIDSKQGHIFNIPAPFFGLLAFPVLVTIGVSVLAGAQFKKWFWRCLEIGAVGGFGFALWLFLLSVYRVHALCPFCLAVDIMVYITVWYLSLYNLEKGYIKLPAKLSLFLRRHHLDLLILWVLLITAFIFHHFWYYYGKHL